MITKVRVKHFRSIEDAEFTLEPLTVLVGPNASGKSNVLDVFRFMGDVAIHGVSSALNKHGGIESIGWRSPSGQTLSPKFSIFFEDLPMSLEYSFALRREVKGDFKVEMESATVQAKASAVQRDDIRHVAFRGASLHQPRKQELLKAIEGDRRRSSRSLDHRRRLIDVALSSLKQQGDKVLRLMSEPSFALSELEYLLGVREADLLIGGLIQAQLFAKSIGFYAFSPDALRRPQQAAKTHPLDTDAANLASVLHGMLHSKSSMANEVKNCLAAAVPGIQDVRVSSVGSHQVIELKHQRFGGNPRKAWFDLVHEADGTIRLLAMLVALYQDPWPSLICLEEPESGIHPGALAVVSDVLQEAPLRSQVIITTHSPELIDMLPVENLRAVSAEGGSTKVGRVAEHQLRSVRRNLMSAGELHSMEGLEPAAARGLEN